MSLYDWFLVPVGSLVIGLVFPGSVLLLWFKKGSPWTVTDAFFTGWFWVAGVSALAIPFVKDTASLIMLVRLCTLVMTCCVLIFLFVRREIDVLFIKNCFKLSFSSGHFFILFFTLGVGLPLIMTHSIGFDDTAHLDFLSTVLKDTPFQDFRNLIHPRFQYLNEEWLAARYPFFGIFIAYFSIKITGNMLFIYYWLGIILMIAVLFKSFEWGSRQNNSKRMGLTVVAVVAAILAIAGPDNYFNYCIYPLQEGKLLFIIGLLYIFLGWNKRKITFDFVLGVGLITAAWLYHLNILLIYGATLPLIFLFIILRSNHNGQRVKALCVILFALCIVTPSMVWPEKGALRIRSFNHALASISEISILTYPRTAFATDITTEINNDRKDGSFNVLQVLEVPFKWFQVGKYIEVYVKRVFSPEIVGVIGAVLLLPLFGGIPSICMVAGLVSFLLVCGQAVKVLPQQSAASMFRSGSFWFVKDLAGIKHQISKNVVYWSDPYTALYLRSLYGVDARGLSEWGQLRLFYPFFNQGIGSSLKSDPGVLHDQQMVLNSRYWGARVGQHWSGANDIIELDIIKESSHAWLYSGKVSHLPSLFRSLFSIVRKQWDNQITIKNAGDITERLDGGDSSFLSIDEIFRDSVVKSISGLKKDDEIEIDFLFTGFGVQLLQQAHENPTDVGSYQPYQLKMKLKGGNSQVKVSQRKFEIEANPLFLIDAKRNEVGNKVRAVFRVNKDIGKLYLLITIIGHGHLRGNGELHAVTINKSGTKRVEQ